MDKKNYVFGKENFMILIISIVIIVLGFWLMSGVKTTEEAGFDPRIFDVRRIVIAPIVTMIGFGLVIWAIMKKTKDVENENINTLKK